MRSGRRLLILSPRQLLSHFALVFLEILVAYPSHIFADEIGRSLPANVAAPIVIPASGEWDGNDGPWSSFEILVGTPAQNMRILISTAAALTLVVLPQSCTLSDSPNCGEFRGGEFFLNQSTSWANNTADISSHTYSLGLGSSLGYEGSGYYGFDRIALGGPGSGGPTLANQTIAGIDYTNFSLGLFGLNPRPMAFTNSSGGIFSYLQNLKIQNLIPSISWSYTAGNQYRLNKVLGSLIIGGYDSSKFVTRNVWFSFNPNEAENRDLLVPIEAITSNSGSTTVSLLRDPISANIDSTIPHIRLPIDACALFQEEFGLSYNSDAELYLVNDSQHNALLSRNASITFTLRNSTAGLDVNITLPYAAFDLTVLYPTVANATRYFPLKQASDLSQYTLGRAFLQEAYLIADYERRNFSVSQCRWDANAQKSIIPILPSDFLNSSPASVPSSPSSVPSSPSSAPSSTSTPDTPPSTGLAPIDIVGIVIGALLIVVTLTLLTFYFMVLKRGHARMNFALLKGPDPILKPELDAEETALREIDGKAPFPPKIYGWQTKIYELPAAEEVASEIGDLELAEFPCSSTEKSYSERIYQH